MSHLPCPSEDLVHQLALGTLGTDALAEVYDHVDECATCAAALLAYVRAPSSPTASPPAPDLATQLPAGTQLGRFEVRAVLGSGNMGTVFTGWDPQLARAVAIKVLRAGRTGAEHGRRLLREAKAMAQVRHPNVVTVFDVGIDQDVIFVAMELVGGPTLRAAMASSPTVAQRLEWLAQVAAGLAAVHAAGLLHRDVKPDNIFIESTASGPRVVIGDFGLAVGDDAVDNDEARRISTTSIATRGAGTPAYMAPEQLEAGEIGPATDVFALGVTAWELLTGRRPFVGRTAIERREAIDAGPGARLVVPGVPPATAALLEACLAAEPSARPRAMELATALRAALGERRPSRRRTALMAVGGVALTAAATTGVVLSRADQAPPRGGVACDPAAAAAWRSTKAPWTARAADTLAPYARDEIVRVMDLRAAAWDTHAPHACAGNVVQRQAWNLCRTRLEAAERAMLDAAIAGPVPDPDGLIFAFTDVELPSECIGRQAGEAAVELGTLDDARRDRVVAALGRVPSLYITDARGDHAAVAAGLDALDAEATTLAPSPLDGELALARAELQPLDDLAGQLARLRGIAIDAARTASSTLAARAWLAAAGAAAAADAVTNPAGAEALTQADWAISRNGDPPRPRIGWNLLAANAAVNRGDRDRAITLYRAAAAAAEAEPLLRGHRAAALGQLSTALGDDAEAVEIYRAFLATPAAAGGFERTERAMLTRELAESLYRLGRSAEARATIAPLLDPSAAYQPIDRFSAEVITATLDDDVGDSAAARRRLERVEREAAVVLGADHGLLADVSARLATALLSLGEWTAAIAAARRAIARFTATSGPKGPGVVYARDAIGNALRASGDLAGAIREHTDASQLGDEIFGPDNPMAAQLHVSLALALGAGGRRDEAIAQLVRAVDVFEATEFAPDVLADAEFELAQLLLATDRARAIELAQRARTRLMAPDLVEATAEARRKIEAWLAAPRRR